MTFLLYETIKLQVGGRFIGSRWGFRTRRGFGWFNVPRMVQGD